MNFSDTIEKLKKIVATKRPALPPKNIRQSAENTDTEVNAKNNVIAKKAKMVIAIYIFYFLIIINIFLII